MGEAAPVRSRLDAELARIGVSLETAAPGEAVIAGRTGETTWIMAALSNGRPIRSWEGSEERALELLRALPDRAGAEVLWQVLWQEQARRPEPAAGGGEGAPASAAKEPDAGAETGSG